MTLNDALWQDSERVSGALCFRGTRVPVSVLFDYLQTDGLNKFLAGYPDVMPDQVEAVIEASRIGLEERFAQRVAA